MEQVLQQYLNEKYEKEFVDLKAILQETYDKGVKDGKASAKAEIINLISGGK